MQIETVETYLDDRILAANHTLIRFSDKNQSHMTVPSHAGTITLTDIGSGAVITGRSSDLLIEEGYIHLGSQCIRAGHNLRSIQIPYTVISIEKDFLDNSHNIANVFFFTFSRSK